MKRFLFICWLAGLYSFNSFSQGDVDTQKKLFYRNEKSLAFLLNSNGWSVNGEYAKRINAANKTLYDADFSILKHPKEVRLPHQSSPNARSFVVGKQNIVWP